MQDGKNNTLARPPGGYLWWWVLLTGALFVTASLGHGESLPQQARIKDVATIEGIRDNQLVGYGLVVGLHGTGDSSQTVFPAQTLIWPSSGWA